ncbi:MAG: RNA polymerase sigma factor [bacterium]
MARAKLERNPDAEAVAELVAKIKANDNESVQILVDWCKHRILLKVQSELSRFPSLWEDVFWEVVEAFVTSIKNGIFERSGVPLAAYVFGIVKNKIHDARKNERKNNLDGALEKAIANKHLFLAKDIRNDFIGFNKHTKQIESILIICLKNLQKKHLQHEKTIVMFYFEDLSLKEIAARMGLAVQKITDLKKYGLTKLRQCLDGYKD